MSLTEDLQNKIADNQAVIDQAKKDKAAAEREQSALERELSAQISGAVDKALRTQDTSIDLLSMKLETTNKELLSVQREMANLNAIMRDTAHLQELYDIKNKELDAEYKDKRAELDRAYKAKCAKLESEYNDKVREHKAAMQEADTDYMRRSAERTKKREELEQEIKTEEEKLRKRKYDLQWKRKGIIIGIIICFLVAVIGGIVLGMWLQQQGYIPFEFTQPTQWGD